jgi:ATP-dependent Clp protease ATP-binding subunit ClpB
LEDGRLTDNKGRVVNFKNTIIIMTSNLGSHLIQEDMEQMDEHNRENKLEQTRTNVMNLLKQTIRPEFLNRIDEIVMFTPLTKEQIRAIVAIQFAHIKEMLENSGIKAELSPAAIDWIAAQGFDPLYGARPVKRALQKHLLNELSKKILAGEVNKDSKILIDCTEEGLVFK